MKTKIGARLEGWSKSLATQARFLALFGDQAGDPQQRAYTDIHLSMHAAFNFDRPDQSSLQFVNDAGEDTKVTVVDILNLRPAKGLRHVCISSCQSGRADSSDAPGEAIGLVAGFIQAGAASVLSALYNIVDQSAADFVPQLYHRRLYDGVDVAEAMRSEVMARLADARSQGQPGLERRDGERDDLQLRIARASDSDLAGTDSISGRGFSLVDWAAFKPTCG